MGQVYKARDTKLGRDVAIKVLPASVANDPERLGRFEREAKLLASLSHTNIAQIYGLEAVTAAGYALVMELAPGKTLEDAIRANVELRTSNLELLQWALPIAVQITYALEAAHERAIVHRDLKPANIKVSDEGAVKVLDFGLAKAFAPGDPESGSAMNSPTLTAQATAAGVILGTAAYMSPEQARGREADKRADVWAFGVVFFEMLSGARLFRGETISDTLAAVLRQDIPWTALPPGTPREIVRLLRRCLERDRKNRLHDIADARIVLEEVARGGAQEDVAPAASAPASPSRTRWLITAAGVVTGLALGFFGGRSTAPLASTASSGNMVRLIVPAPRGVTTVSEPSVASDGSFVVFVGQVGSRSPQLYIQRLDQTAPVAVERTEGATMPVVSPDGRWIAFRRAQRMEKIAIDGGEPLPITNATSDAPGAMWLDNKTIIFCPSWLSELAAVAADGGAVRKISTLDAAHGEIGHWFPSALPDGHHVLMTIWVKGAGLTDSEVAILDLDTGKHHVLFKGAEGRYLAPGFIVYFRAGAYHAVRFDAKTLNTTGESVRVLEDAYGNEPQGELRQEDLSAGGTLAYLSGPSTLVRQLTWISQGGKTEALPFPARSYNSATVSADGTRAAVGVLEAGRNVIRVLDLNLNRPSDDALDLPGSNSKPVWYPDGKRLAFRSVRKGDFDAYWKDVTSTGPAEPLLVTDRDDTVEAFVPPDGKSVIVRQSEPDGRYLPKLMTIDQPGPLTTLLSFTTSSGSAISPDGKFLAFTSMRSGAEEAYVQAMSGSAAPERVSAGGALKVIWSRDGRTLLYLRPPEIIEVTYKIDGGRFRATGERIWSRVEGDYHEDIFELGADGRVLAAIVKDHVPREIRVITNWQQEIAKKVK